MKIVLLSGNPVNADVEAAPVGVYDVIREDIRRISTVQPVNRVFIERSDTGYRGVLFSKEQPFMFALSGVGFIAKPIEDSSSVITYCARLEESENRQSAIVDASIAERAQDEFNLQFANGSPDEPSVTGTPEQGPSATLVMTGPMVDVIERIPGTYQQMRQGASRHADKQTNRPCGGGVVVNAAGKLLLVKPTNGYGDYDWTFPKGYPRSHEKSSQTAVREVHEETGYTSEVERFVGRFTHNDGGTCDYYYCRAANQTPDDFDTEETEAIRWVTVIEALELLNDDVDVKILAQANQLVPQLLIKAGHKGVMIALQLPSDVAKQIAIEGGEPVESMHITLAYLGKDLTEAQKKLVAQIVRAYAAQLPSVKATLGGVGRFSASHTSEGRDVVYLSVDSPDITAFRQKLVELLDAAGIQTSQAHGFTPHVTLAYVDKKAKTPIDRLEPIELTFTELGVWIAGKSMQFPLAKLAKALPRLSDDAKEANAKKVGAKPIGAATKKLGSGGRVRYNYPGEQTSKKPQAKGQPNQAPNEGNTQQPQSAGELPHPDLPSPQPNQDPIVHDDAPKVDTSNDPRPNDPTKQQAKHTVNVQEFCAAVGVNRSVLQQIAQRLNDKQKFVSFLSTHLREYARDHGLDGEFFALVYDVLIGKIPEGTQPEAQTPQAPQA